MKEPNRVRVTVPHALTGNDVPYAVRGSCLAAYLAISTVERGDLRPVHGLPAPWTHTAVEAVRPEGEGFQCDDVGFGTLLFTL